MLIRAEHWLRQFLRLESSAGLALMLAAILALLVANSPLSVYYDLLISTPVAIQVGALEIAKPLFLWINDGLMAVFFLLIGLELKRELLAGELRKLRGVLLPVIGAAGGMVIPAAVYVYFNRGDPVAMQGWAIPAATDIAFALGVLSLLGNRVPQSLKLFLVTLAIFDDLGAIVIIALFYTARLSPLPLMVVAGCLLLLVWFNRRQVTTISSYVLIGVIMWVAMLKSGVHATLTGVLLALFIPLQGKKDDSSPLMSLESDLHPVVAYAILPLFAFVNAGVDLRAFDLAQLWHPVSAGIILGLFAGKQLGIFGFCWLAAKLRLVVFPDGMGWGALYGLALLSGIGFTMSLFIGSLAFEATGSELLFDERIGILAGSLLSGITGYLVLRWVLRGAGPQK